MPDIHDWQAAFYYTLSTIAQTLAAAFGILSTFMLYRFQHAESKIETHEEGLTHTADAMEADVRSDALVAALKEGDASGVDAAVSEAVVVLAPTRASPMHQKGVKELRAAGKQISFWAGFHKRALRRLRHALILTVATIGYCLVQLPIQPLLTMRLPLAATLCAVAVGLSLVCLTLYARLILLLLVPEAEGE